ncbi:MAG: F0F1 ATP synthase subunit B [Gemmatirosa sp.]|nr:F0F1 ATP synthase subunit B [Gemmatirosa sp.]
MRTLRYSLPLVLATASPLLAQEEASGPVNLLEPRAGLMVWTLVIFVILLVILSKFAFKPLVAAVEARERSLEEAIEGAKRDRDEAARLLAEQRTQLEGARGEAQRYIAEGRAASEKMKADLLEQTRQQQQELLERARREIDAERERAIADLRREAVDLALAGASKVVERNLDDAGNRQLVENFLATLSATSLTDGAKPRG